MDVDDGRALLARRAGRRLEQLRGQSLALLDGFDAAGMDRSVVPGNDFFNFVDGTAVRQMVIPADRTSWGAFNILGDLSQRQVHSLLEAAIKASPSYYPAAQLARHCTCSAAAVETMLKNFTAEERAGMVQDGETVEIEVQGVGKMSLKVRDPLKRTWERGIYMGVDSTNPEAIKRHRPKDK